MMPVFERLKESWNPKWDKWVAMAVAIILLFGVPLRSDGPYRGRVIDAETGKPLAGVLVLGTWSYMVPSPAGGTSHCLGAKETLTDENGDFEISGRRAALFMPLGSMDFAIYKIGYRKLGTGPWASFKIDRLLIKMVRWEGDRVIVPLKRVPKDQLRTDIGSPPFINCGPRNGKPLVEYNKVRKEFQRAIKR
jgi:hypothetical protein